MFRQPDTSKGQQFCCKARLRNLEKQIMRTKFFQTEFHLYCIKRKVYFSKAAILIYDENVKQTKSFYLSLTLNS